MAQDALLPPIDVSTVVATASTQAPPGGIYVSGDGVNRWLRIATRLIFGVALVLLVGAAAAGYYRQSHDGEIMPGVQVAGVNLGGMTEAEAVESLEQQAKEFERSRAHFDFGSQRWAPTMEELGVSVDVEGTVSQAMDYGREGSGANQFLSTLESAGGTNVVPLQTSMNSAVFEAYMDQVDLDINMVPRNAEITVDGTTVEVVPEQSGTVVDRVRLQALVVSALESLQAPTNRLPTIDQSPTVFANQLQPAVQQLERAFSESVTLNLGKQKWTVRPENIGPFVVTLPAPGGVDVTLDQEALTAWLTEKYSDEVNREPVDARVAWDGEKAVAISDSEQGLRLRPATLASYLTASFLSDHLPVEMPVSVIEPTIGDDRIEELGITTRLAGGTSSFAGSGWDRATNIYVGAAILNGILIPPGETFSFNRSIGVITEELGFVESQVVANERIGRDIGGGICQVSTTVFRAAIYAGLPISEWHPHRYRLSFYEQEGWELGLDASILQPEGDPFGGGDFQFVNDTGSWLLMESWVDGETVGIILYGPDLDYTVDITGPAVGESYNPAADIEVVDYEAAPGTLEQTEWAGEGVDVSYTRTVYDADGNVVRQENWDTHFYPRSNVYKVSPDMVGLSPAEGNTDPDA